MSVYFDTSAFVKLLVPEAGSTQARRAWSEASECVSSVALLAEARAALARTRRQSTFTSSQYASAVADLFARWDEMTATDVTEPLAHRAGVLAEAYGLRGYDAIHLATAETVLDAGDVMVVSDGRLAEAAASIGIEALIPAHS